MKYLKPIGPAAAPESGQPMWTEGLASSLSQEFRLQHDAHPIDLAVDVVVAFDQPGCA
jgi:hypothetical protein